MPKIELSHGTIHYRDQGSGPVILLVHGLLVNGTLWDPLLTRLSPSVRCIVPDLPLGSHLTPMKDDADLSPHGLADLIAELIERLELGRVTLVGNDTGGALCQLVCVRHPGSIERLVLTNCDSFENFPPPAFRPLVRFMGRVPGAVTGLDLLARSRMVRRAAMSAAPLTVEPVPDPVVKGWVTPLHDAGVRRDLVRVARGISPDVMVAAAPELESFDRPTLIAWGVRDKFFRISDAERLKALLPDARLERIDNARTFVPMDAPDQLAQLITEFVATQGAEGSG